MPSARDARLAWGAALCLRVAALLHLVPGRRLSDIVADARSVRRAEPWMTASGSRAEALCLLWAGSGRGLCLKQDAEELVSSVQTDIMAAVRQDDGSGLGHQPLQALR